SCVVRTKPQALHSVIPTDRIVYILFGKSRQGSRGGKLHLFIDCRGSHVQGATENEWETEHIVYLIGIVGAPSCDDDIIPAGPYVFVGNFRVGVCHGKNNRPGRNGSHHIWRDCTFYGAAHEH